mgnify:CR=1 FL=1
MSKNVEVDFELAEDTQDLIANNDDADCASDELKDKLFAFKEGTLLKIEKSINSPIIIESAEKVTEEKIEEM